MTIQYNNFEMPIHRKREHILEKKESNELKFGELI